MASDPKYPFPSRCRTVLSAFVFTWPLLCVSLSVCFLFFKDNSHWNRAHPTCGDDFHSLKSCLTLWNLLNCSTPGFPVLYYLLEFAQIHVHWVSDAIQPSHPLLPPSPPSFNLSQHQDLLQWVSSLHQVVKVLEFQHQPFQHMFRVYFL